MGAKSAKRVIRLACVTSTFALFWSGGTLFAWVLLPIVALFVRDRIARMRVCQRLLSTTFRVFHGYMRALDLLDARIVGDIPHPSGGPVVIVANHTTLVDMTAVLSRFPHTCCIAKTAFAKSIFVGRLIRMCGFIPAGTNMIEHSAAITMTLERLAEGFDVLVFPEGTRSPPGGMGALQRGAFEIACRARVPVVPLFLRCTPSVLTKGRTFWDNPDEVAVLTIEPQEPVDPAELGYNSRRLRDRLEADYRSLLEDHGH